MLKTVPATTIHQSRVIQALPQLHAQFRKSLWITRQLDGSRYVAIDIVEDKLLESDMIIDRIEAPPRNTGVWSRFDMIGIPIQTLSKPVVWPL
jgi:hypothetical protein